MSQGNILYLHSHTYEKTCQAECPAPGYENETVLTWHESKPAFWQDGWIYVRKEDDNDKFAEFNTAWAKK